MDPDDLPIDELEADAPEAEPFEPGPTAPTWLDTSEPEGLVHLAGTLTSPPGDEPAEFEVTYDPARVGEDLANVEMSGAAWYMLGVSYPPGSVVSAPAQPLTRVDYADPSSIWAVFAYNGAKFTAEQGVQRKPAPAPPLPGLGSY